MDMTAVHKLLANGGYAENGWNGLAPDTTDAVEKKHETELKRFVDAQQIAVCFMGASGVQCLQKLKEMTIEKPTWPAEGNGGFYDAAAYGFAREGQNSVIRHIESCIRIAEEGPPVQQGAVKTRKSKKSTIPTN